ncbi:MAG: cysteine desulfurase-like protein [Pirellulaceae bacterium]
MTWNSARLQAIRQQFPSLQRLHEQQEAVYLDGPAGSQVPRRVAERIAEVMIDHQANRHGRFETSRQVDAVIDAAHQAAADFLGSNDPGEIVFGANMTTLTFAFSRALARTWKRGDRIAVTRLDHDANVTPWKIAAEECGAEVVWIDIDPVDCTLNLEQLEAACRSPLRLLAITAASNSVGTQPPLDRCISLAHQAGALVFVDAVHLAPHQRVDVARLNADFLICSAYKFFGPHIGILWGRRSLLESLRPYKVEPAPETVPEKWMTGTQNPATLAGVTEAIDYLASLADHPSTSVPQSKPNSARPQRLEEAFRQIQLHEMGLIERLIGGLQTIRGVTIHGITDPKRFCERVPTLALSAEGWSSIDLAQALGDRGIYAWHGNYYALQLARRLGKEKEGMLRLGCMHYNTAEEVDRVVATLAQILDRR